jgi:glycosyltransferase involved in cell wall biosynthesis
LYHITSGNPILTDALSSPHSLGYSVMTVPISIVITTYNRERYLSAAIESILAQTKQDFELLIWDDGSIDRTVEIAQNYAKHDARVRVVIAEHQGRGLSLKLAIAQTTGTYIGIVDSDDLLAPTTLEETVCVLEQEPEVGMVLHQLPGY